MSKSIIGDQRWAEMTEAQKLETVRRGQATLKQMTQGLLDGPEELRKACREFLIQTDASFASLPIQVGAEEAPLEIPSKKRHTSGNGISQQLNSRTRGTRTAKQRFGLPEGFVPRLQRYGRSVLLESDVYRLPNGQEFIPCHPKGTLGRVRHLYALVTAEQYLNGKQGSVYIRTDGRIFNYSVDNANPVGDIFDTGYTICDLERTGRYAPSPDEENKKHAYTKQRRAAHGG